MSIEKIIVLEDDAIVRNNLENFLRRQRFDVASAPTLAAAREYLNKDNFDLIFMDMRLPDGEGIAASDPPAKTARRGDDRLRLRRIRR